MENTSVLRAEERQMTSDNPASSRILGSLRSEDGDGIARMEDRFDRGIEEVWAALTEPPRLARWYGEVTGKLCVGGEFQVRHADGERIGHVDACEAPQHLRLRLCDAAPRAGQPEEMLIEIELTAAGGQTILVVEARGLPRTLLAAYGTGVQIHVEHLAEHISGRENSDTEARWEQLFPAYEVLAADVS